MPTIGLARIRTPRMFSGRQKRILPNIREVRWVAAVQSLGALRAQRTIARNGGARIHAVQPAGHGVGRVLPSEGLLCTFGG
jgi:hypothetical protein